MQFFDIHIVGIVSSVSAQKLKCPSSTQAGKFQLELIFHISVKGADYAHQITAHPPKVSDLPTALTCG